VKALLVAVIGLLYAALNYYSQMWPPVVTLEPHVLGAIRYGVIISTFVVFCYAGYYYTAAAADAEAALEEERDLLEVTVETRTEALRDSEARYRKLYEESKKREELYGSVLQSSADGIVIRDLQGRAKYVSPSFTKTFGWTMEEFEDEPIGFVPPSERQATKAVLDEVILKGVPSSGFETKRSTKDGRFLDISLSASRYRDHEGNPAGTLAVLRDVTEPKRLEGQLRQVQKMEAIGTLAAGIAHDFNNILFVIIGYTEMALESVSKESRLYSHFQQIFEAAIRAKDLVSQILAFSRQSEQAKQPVDIRPVVKETIKFLRASVPSITEIRTSIAPDPGTVFADPTQIHQVLMNLCTNAAHAMHESGGVMEVGLTHAELDSDFTRRHEDLDPGLYLRLTVSDTGHGMSNETLQRIFEPYFTTKKPGEGTGMGLAVVHGIVKSHGGAMTCYSELGRGSRFHVFLPVIQDKASPRSPTDLVLPTGSERILLVDDEQEVAHMVEQMLEPLGYTVAVRTSSVEALELFRVKPNHFDLVLSDMTMPNMTGIDLAKKILGIRSNIPIVLCTGFADPLTEEAARSLGIAALVMKPVLKSEIARTIRDALDRGAGNEG